MMRLIFLLLLALLGLAQATPFFYISESFKGPSAPGWVLGGNAVLTGNGTIDPLNDGYLRLTPAQNGQVGYAYYDTAFPAGTGFEVDFEYLSWGGQTNYPSFNAGPEGADGIALFLFDGSTTNFQIGYLGGGLGYCPDKLSTPVKPGLSNAYVGIALDEWGNFTNPYHCPDGPGRINHSVGIRGPGNGTTGYNYLTHYQTTNDWTNPQNFDKRIDLPKAYQSNPGSRPPSTEYYRRVKIRIEPTTGGSYQITVDWQTSPSGSFQTLIGGFTLPDPPPPTLKLGFAGTTGAATNYHEIRNVRVRPLADLQVSKNGPATVAPGDTIYYTITVTNNGPGAADGSTLIDTVPTSISGVTWICTASGGAQCGSTFGNGNNINLSIPTLPENGTVTLIVMGTVSLLAGGTTLTNTAQVVPPMDQSLGEPKVLDPNETNNTATVNTSVSVYKISGTVYHDQEPNGAKNSGENWSDGPTVYVKLIQGSSVIDVRTVGPGNGNFTFTGVAPGSYTLIVDDNNTTADTTPTPPAGWRFINPPSGSRSVTVGNTNVGGQDFGLFHGGVVKGRVFYDDGEGSGTANNALQDGTERGVGSVTVTATDGTNTRTATTDGSGLYRLYIPASWGNVTLSHPVRPATGWNNGSTATLVASWNDAQSPSSSVANIGLGSAGNLAGQTITRNFGVVRTSEFKPDQSGQITSPGTLTYAHLFRPGTLGSVNLTLENTPSFTYQARRDANCNGAWDSTEDFGPLSLNFPVDSTWPRDPDGRLTACALEVRVQAPAGLPAGYTDIALFKSGLTWQNNPSVTEERSLTDTTTVILAGQLKLSKQVRNATQNTSFATSAQAKPGEKLEYRITYQNIGSQPIFDVVLQDPIPFFSTLVQNAYGTGEVELVCPDGTTAQIDLGPTSSISLNLATHCTLPNAPHPNGSSAEALLPGQGGYFEYQVQVQ